jgi:glycerol-3-phosphate dehydrogenase
MRHNRKPITAPELSLRSRAANLERMRCELFDVAVIGGGVTGAGVALDAASRGLKVALIEKRDFASGTSSRSSKLIHGGLRYLEQFHFRLVRESLRERTVLRRMAPHLSKPLSFLVPVYSSPEGSPLGTNRLKLAAGLWLYDLLAGRQNIARHRWLAPDAALKLAPALDPRGLRGAFLYYDCLTDDARLVIEVVKSAAAHGAVIANYVHARGFETTAGRISRIQLEDELDRGKFALRAKTFVNATGVWSDEVSRFSNSNAQQKVRPSKGIHIVTRSEKLQNETAVLIPSLGERRFLFVIPWQGRTVIGTTDTDYDGDLDEPLAETAEVDRVVASAARAFPIANLSGADVISTFAGLRPLVVGNKQSTKELSREEGIFEDEAGLITITGGKLTTWRRMAERVVDLAAAALERVNGTDRSRSHGSVTAGIRLAGGALASNPNTLASEAAATFGVDVAVVEHLIHTYGSNYRTILELTRESDEFKSTLIDGLPHIEAEVVYAARYEMAATVEDILSRRTRVDLLAGDNGRSCSTRIAELLKQEL